MSTQSIRNKVNNSIRRVISDVKRKAIEEGKKKVTDLKDQLLSPDQIIKMLTADINPDTCSIEGRKKFEEKAKQLKDQLDELDDIAQGGLDVLKGLEEKIGSISSKIELPESNIPNPIKEIKEITDFMKQITEPLQYVIMAAPAILGTQIAVPGGGSSSGLVIANTNNGANTAKAKIAEFTNLFTSLPKVLDKYISMADIVYDNINKIKTKIQAIVDEIAKLKTFIIYLELDFEDKCNNLVLPINPPVPDPPVPPSYPTLEDIIKEAEELYGNILEDLIARGDQKGIKRIYTLGAQFQRIKNTTVTIIDI